jgi:hypothetical protein
MGNAQSHLHPPSATPAAAGQSASFDNNPSQDQLNPQTTSHSGHEPIDIPQPQDPSNRRSSLYRSISRRWSSRPAPSSTFQRQQDPVEEMDAEAEQERHPLVPMDVDDEYSPGDPIPSSTPYRSNSAVSRLGSRVLPDSVARALLSSGEETPAEGQALRSGRPSGYEGIPRFSITGSIRRRMEARNDSRLDFRRHTIRGPFPLGATHQQISNEHESSLDIDRVPSPSISDATPRIVRRDTRLRRIRNSLASPFASLLPGSQNRSSAYNAEGSPGSRPARVTFADESDQLLPPPSSAGHRAEHDEMHELDAAEPETRHILPTITSGMSTIRRFNRLRSRSRLMRPENPPLSQVLQLAAAAIAAQLSGHTAPSPNGSRQLASEAFDDIQNFVQTLQDAANAQAGEPIDVNAAENDLPAVNFMRVFQFPNDERGSPITSQASSRNVDVGDLDQITSPDRSVTLVLVGVRSMPNGHETTAGEGGPLGGPSLDNLLSLPFLPPSHEPRGGGGPSSALFQRDARSRFRGRRRSMTNFSFPAQYETQRHHRPRASSGLLPSDQATLATATPLSESPPGPHPPPSTPADIRSGHATPIRRPSSASAVHGGTLPGLDEDTVQSSVESTPESAYNVARQRQRSDSEFARRPDLGSGAARRNGVVEPDTPSVGSGRSWLIYVVGTNVSPDHPAFTMPSLFTDNPSYEDMQMLSALLGPVKPPVATAADVTSAGGLYRTRLFSVTGLLTDPVDPNNTSPLTIGVGERCLICLSDYELQEEVRQLAKCSHVFHRECIDEVRSFRKIDFTS